MVTGSKLTVLGEGLERGVREKEGSRMTTRLLPCIPLWVETFLTEVTIRR